MAILQVKKGRTVGEQKLEIEGSINLWGGPNATQKECMIGTDGIYYSLFGRNRELLKGS